MPTGLCGSPDTTCRDTAKDAGTPMARPPIPPRQASLLPFQSSLSEKAEVTGAGARAVQWWQNRTHVDNYCFHQSTLEIAVFHRQLSTKKSRRNSTKEIGQYGLKIWRRLIISVQREVKTLK